MKDNYQAESDARTLQAHAAVTADPKRHSAAHKVLKGKVKEMENATESSRSILEKKTAKRLKKAFAPTEGHENVPRAGYATKPRPSEA